MPFRLRNRLIPLALLIAAAATLALAQSANNTFTAVRVIGEPRPQGIRYNQPLDQFAWVAPGGVLALIDATTFQPQHTLYTGRTYSAYTFSDDGTLFAVAYDRRVDLWDAQTGALLEAFEPEGILSIQGPLQFADDNGLLLVNSVVPAPQEIRRSENDTSILPWLWDIPAALGTAESQLPGRASALPFFEYRNGFIMGYADKVIATRPGRLEVLDVGTRERNVLLSTIDSDRFERDPVDVWRSQLTDNALFTLPIERGLTHIDTTDGSSLSIPAAAPIGLGQTGPAARDLYERLLRDGRPLPIGAAETANYNSLTALLLGPDYRESAGFASLRVSLVDVLEPISPTAAPNRLLVYVFNEDTERGTFQQVTPPEVTKTALHPLRTQIAFYFQNGEIIVYDIASGDIVRQMNVTYPDGDGRALLAFDPTGDEILYDFQRFEVATGRIVVEDLNVRLGFDNIAFSPDSRRLNTLNNNPVDGLDWWQWDIETGAVVRREHIRLGGALVQTSADVSRYLVQVEENPLGETKTGLAIVEAGAQSRPTVLFDNVPGTTLQGYYPSPDWRHVVAVYYGLHDLEGIALYSFENGREWFISAENIPGGDHRFYWQDNNTFVAAPLITDRPLELTQQDLGQIYHPTGLPECLVDAFPDDFERWIPVWERNVYFLGGERLRDLTADVCDALPSEAGAVDDILTTPTPTPAPTRESVTTFRPTPPVLANIPTCFAASFPPNQIEEYADVWRQIASGLSADEQQTLAEIICEGAAANSIGQTGSGASGAEGSPKLLIDIDTQRREYSLSPEIRPYSAPSPYSLALVGAAYERTTGNALSGAVLSPNGQLLAHRVGGGYVQIERLTRPYTEVAAAATATQSVFTSQTPIVPFISLAPTATPTPIPLGLPLPTPTATITPTSPPTADAANPLPDFGTVTYFCDNELSTLADPPPDYAPDGVLYTGRNNMAGTWALDPLSGETAPAPDAPPCYLDGSCNRSVDGVWLLNPARASVSLANGTDPRDLNALIETDYPLESIAWNQTEALVLMSYIAPPDPVNKPLALETYQLTYDPSTGTLRGPSTDTLSGPAPRPTQGPFEDIINEIPTQIHDEQPIHDRYWVGRKPFTVDSETVGYRYYMLDRTTDEAVYFARLAEPGRDNVLPTRWDTRGERLYYFYPGEPDIAYAFDPATASFYVYGEDTLRPNGFYSWDGTFRYMWERPSREVIIARSEADLPIPELTVYELTTGAQRRYCLPTVDPNSFGEPLVLSPNSRYLAFRARLYASYFDDSPTPIPNTTPTPTYGLPDSEPSRQAGMPHTFLLDLQTGSLTFISSGESDLLAWVAQIGDAR